MVILVNAASIADNSRKRHLGGELLECVVVALYKVGSLEKIEGEIATDTEFREDS